jgi:anti-anti-sigma regulatory factor
MVHRDAQVFSPPPKDSCLVEWLGQLAIVTLPDRIEESNAGRIGEELLLVIDGGATALIADMTATVSCDHAGADALVYAYRRALVTGTPVRLVVTAQAVQRVLTLNGLDPLVPVYSSLAAARATGIPATVAPVTPRQGTPMRAQHRKPGRTTHEEANVQTHDRRPEFDWTVVLRRRPARMMHGHPEGGYTDMFEIICCDCGDNPGLDYREVSPALQRIRGPYTIAPGIAAYETHAKWHQDQQPARQPARPRHG